MTPNPNQLPPLPEPDTHCFDDDTGKDVWSYTADQMHAYALAALAQQAQPVANDRDCPHCNYTGSMHCGDVAKTHGGILNPKDCSHAKLFGSRITTPPAPQVPAPVDELPELNPEDVVVDVVLKQLGGFAPVTTHGVRVTHKPSFISVVVDSERSQHRNRQLALEALRAITHHQDHPAPAPQPAVPVVEAFAEGWRMAADWANRDDLLPDMDSPQYAKERDERLAELRPAVEPMTDGALALLADVTPVEHDDSNGPGSVECPACSAYMHMSWKAGVRTDEIEQLLHDADCPAEWARRQLAKGITAKAERGA